MKKYVAIAAIAAMAVAGLGLGAGVVLAQDEAPESVGVTITGVNYCLLCALAKGEMGNAPAPYARINALKVTEAKDVEGNALSGLTGKTIHYLPSKAAEILMANDTNAGKTVKVIGKLFKNENALLVETVEMEESSDGGDDDDWDELPVGKQSGLQVL